jgi:hypothetical protein
MVEGLERQWEAELAGAASAEPIPIDMENIPSGDEIAAELQRFLREEGQG